MCVDWFNLRRLVFDIMQGVSINIFVKTDRKEREEFGQVFYADLYGKREDKYHQLDYFDINNVDLSEIKITEPYCFFVPKDFSDQEEYDKGFKIDELIKNYLSGVQSGRDDIFVDMNCGTLAGRVQTLLSGDLTPEFISKYKVVDSSSYPLLKRMQASVYDKNKIFPYFYRIFDKRYIYYDKDLIKRSFYNVLQHTLRNDNISLLISKQQSTFDFQHVIVADSVADMNAVSMQTKEGNYVFPLYLYTENMGSEERIVNFNKDLYEEIAKGLNYLPCYDDNVRVDPISEYNGVLYPQDLFDYIYAVLHSPSYRERYKEFLKIDFPRIPYPTDWEKFRDLAEKGEELRLLHLMEDLPNSTGISFPVAGTLQVECYRWAENRVYINSEQYFEGVPESAWTFYIGGYQPAQKWLKDRKGMALSFEDVKHYQRIIYVLQQTERIMKDIDNI